MDRRTFWLHVEEMRGRGCSVDVYVDGLDDEDREGFLLAWLDLALLARSRFTAFGTAKALVLRGRRDFEAALSVGARRAVAA